MIVDHKEVVAGDIGTIQIYIKSVSKKTTFSTTISGTKGLFLDSPCMNLYFLIFNLYKGRFFGKIMCCSYVKNVINIFSRPCQKLQSFLHMDSEAQSCLIHKKLVTSKYQAK